MRPYYKKAQPNDVFTAKWGPAWPNAGLVRMTGACRVVAAKALVDQQLPWSRTREYITYGLSTFLAGQPSLVANVWSYNCDYADRITLLSRPTKFYWVARIQAIGKPGLAPYYRAYIVELPY